MLRIITGKAHSGKTAAIMKDIAKAASDLAAGPEAALPESGGAEIRPLILLVPEQYSHEAERELCRACGDGISLFAEVMSFTGLARAVTAVVGGVRGELLDDGGRLLCMARAVSQVQNRLKVYRGAAGKPELQQMLLRAVDELKTAGIEPKQLETAAGTFPDALGDKLRDLQLIAESYDLTVAAGHADPNDRLTLLKEDLPRSGMGPEHRIYIDGFTDFTAQQMAVLETLLKLGVQLTVCLTMDRLRGSAAESSEVFALSRRTAYRLTAMAEEHGTQWAEEYREEEPEKEAQPLRFFTDHMFRYGSVYPQTAETGSCPVRTAETGSMLEECEFAAAQARKLVRETGCRWRDIAVAVRGFDEYRTLLENTFRYYGVPLYTADSSELLARPVPALLSNAYRILRDAESGSGMGRWEVEDVTAYMRTGLTGLSRAECDRLENYIFLWQLQGSAWTGNHLWQQDPAGYGHTREKEEEKRELAEQLEELNRLRERLRRPLLHFAERCKKARTGQEHCAAVTSLLQELELPQQLERRSAELLAEGEARLAEEYHRLWGILVQALEQCHAILQDTPMTAEEFGRLLIQMLSGYQIGTIPISVDRVSAGDFDRMRRRNLRHLIVLGASDARLPAKTGEGGVFSGEDRRRLCEAELNLDCGEDEAWREFALIYNCLSLPSESLTLCYPILAADGSRQQPSFVINRAREMFAGSEKESSKTQRPDPLELRLSAPGPALTAAVTDRRSAAQAAAEWFAEREPERWQRVKGAAALAAKEPLQPGSVSALYGRSVRLGATRVESFADCRFGYFCRYGLNAKPHEAAQFRAPEMGTFMHYILEHVAAEVREKGGFIHVTDDELRARTKHYTEEYVSRELNGFAEKDARFRYIFRRLERETVAAVLDMAQELRESDFEPLAFELDFGEAARTGAGAVSFGEGDARVVLNGVADRVDGWTNEGTTYLRVADYKSGPKSFSVSDVYYGRGLQMLLYLFALTRRPELLDGACKEGPVEAAGVMYVPLRGKFEPVNNKAEEAAGLRELQKEKRRRGLVLNEEAVLQAWDRSEGRTYCPAQPENARTKPTEKLADRKQLGMLETHVERLLAQLAGELKQGRIDIEPRVCGKKSACDYCNYASVCGFEDLPEAVGREEPKRKAAEVWELLEKTEENGSGEEKKGKGDGNG